MSGKRSPEFQLIDDKIQLLLEATQNLKKITRDLKRNKYDTIRELITENYPKDGDSEKYPNYDIIEEVLTEERVSQFKKAVECGKKIGSGSGIPFAQASLLKHPVIELNNYTDCLLKILLH